MVLCCVWCCVVLCSLLLCCVVCCVLVLCRLGLGSIFHRFGDVLGALGSIFGRFRGSWVDFWSLLGGLWRLLSVHVRGLGPSWAVLGC